MPAATPTPTSLRYRSTGRLRLLSSAWPTGRTAAVCSGDCFLSALLWKRTGAPAPWRRQLGTTALFPSVDYGALAASFEAVGWPAWVLGFPGPSTTCAPLVRAFLFLQKFMYLFRPSGAFSHTTCDLLLRASYFLHRMCPVVGRVAHRRSGAFCPGDERRSSQRCCRTCSRACADDIAAMLKRKEGPLCLRRPLVMGCLGAGSCLKPRNCRLVAMGRELTAAFAARLQTRMFEPITERGVQDGDVVSEARFAGP